MNFKNHNLIGTFVTALFVLFISPKVAMSDPPSDINAMLSTLFVYAAPTNPLKKGQKEIKVVPAYILGDDPVAEPPGGTRDPSLNRNEKLSGWGWASSFVLGFSEHFGMSILGAGVQESGTIDSPPIRTYPTDRNSYRGGEQKGSGYVGAVSFIYDPFKGDGFRFPLLLGVSVNSFSSEVNATNAMGEALGDKGSNQAPGVLLGGAPQFDIWKIRVSPYLIVSHIFSNGTATERFFDSTGTATEHPKNMTNDTTGGVGIDFTYRPLGLGFNYVPDFSGVTAYTLKWSKKWGGEESKE